MAMPAVAPTFQSQAQTIRLANRVCGDFRTKNFFSLWAKHSVVSSSSSSSSSPSWQMMPLIVARMCRGTSSSLYTRCQCKKRRSCLGIMRAQTLDSSIMIWCRKGDVLMPPVGVVCRQLVLTISGRLRRWEIERFRTSSVRRRRVVGW